MNRSIFRRALAPLAVVVVAAACSGAEGTGPNLLGGENPDATVFLTQQAPQDAVMDALYTGKVLRDEQGCLRTESANGALVIWPYGFKLHARLGGLHVENAEGRSIGRIGGNVRMGGGYAPAAYADTYLTDANHTLADTRCPAPTTGSSATRTWSAERRPRVSSVDVQKPVRHPRRTGFSFPDAVNHLAGG